MQTRVTAVKMSLAGADGAVEHRIAAEGHDPLQPPQTDFNPA